jgi:hypothetical protein
MRFLLTCYTLAEHKDASYLLRRQRREESHTKHRNEQISYLTNLFAHVGNHIISAFSHENTHSNHGSSSVKPKSLDHAEIATCAFNTSREVNFSDIVHRRPWFQDEIPSGGQS